MENPANPHTSTSADVLNVNALCRRWGLSENTVRAAIARGDIPSIRVGRRVLIPVASLEALLGRATAAHPANGRRGTPGALEASKQHTRS